MHSRLIFLHSARVKFGRDAKRKVIRQSNAELRREPKRITGQFAKKSCQVFPWPPVP